MDRKKVLLIGATGFIGKSLGISLCRAGYDLVVLTRSPDRARADLPFPCEAYSWTREGESGLERLEIPHAALDGVYAVVNLAGESIAEGRWTAARKKALKDSRVHTTSALARAVADAKNPPQVWLQTSATGFYGPRGDQDVTESSPSGQGFLADICKDWEAAARLPTSSATRLIHLRVGVVLGRGGGALPKLVSLRQKGASVVIGSGDQWLSWIHIDDLVNLMVQAIGDARFSGPINGVAPNPCTWRDLDLALGEGGGAGLKAPSFAIRLATGEGPIALAASQKIFPEKAQALGFGFKFPDLETALFDILGPKDQRSDGWLYTTQFIPAPISEVAPFFADEKNLEAITPPWLHFKVLGKSTPSMESGTLIRYRLKLHGVPVKWVTKISDWHPEQGFVDEQLKGPYAKWVHRHTFEPFAGGTLMTDYVRFRLPMGLLGNIAAGWAVSHDVDKIFAYRRRFIDKLYKKVVD